MGRKKYSVLIQEELLPIHLEGLRFAIRRGDLALAKLCFDTLWSSYPQKLLWALPSIFVQECWYLLGELADLMAPPFKGLPEDEQVIWRLVELAVTSPKNQDVCALHLIKNPPTWLQPAVEGFSIPANNEKDMLDHLFWAFDQYSLMDIGKNLLEGWHQSIEDDQFSEYLNNLFEYLIYRSTCGGMVAMSRLFLIAMSLFISRRFDKDTLDKRLSKYPSPTSIKVKKVPWYCFSVKTTKLGERAFERFQAKVDAYPEELLRCFNFFFNESIVNSSNCYPTEAALPEPWETAYWVPLGRQALQSTGIPVAKARKLWKDELEPLLKAEVEAFTKGK